jgi:hypothetical protein
VFIARRNVALVGGIAVTENNDPSVYKLLNGSAIGEGLIPLRTTVLAGVIVGGTRFLGSLGAKIFYRGVLYRKFVIAPAHGKGLLATFAAGAGEVIKVFESTASRSLLFVFFTYYLPIKIADVSALDGGLHSLGGAGGRTKNAVQGKTKAKKP